MDIIVIDTGLPQAAALTKTRFRARLSMPEQTLIDNFNVPEYADRHPKIQALDIEQRAQVRTAIAAYRDAAEVVLSDPRTVAFVELLDAVGLLDSPGRAAQILGAPAA